MQNNVFFRWHQDVDAPCFCAHHAWSAPWGSEFSADGTTYRCPACDGTGEDRTEPVCERCDGTGDDDGYTCRRCGGTGEDTECRDCDGEGWVDCDRGYSCTRSAEELADYFQEHAKGAPADDHGTVIVFEGEHVGDGCDGEPLVVPTRVVETLTWSAFAAKHLHKEDSITNPLGCDLIDATDYTTGQDDIEADHVAQLAQSMRVNGWQGPPLVVLPDYARAYTGTHRLAAAEQAGLDTVPAVDLEDLFDAHGLDLWEICDTEGLSVLMDRPEVLTHLPASTLAAYGLDDIC